MKYFLNFLVGLLVCMILAFFIFLIYKFGWKIFVGIPVCIFVIYMLGESFMDLFKINKKGPN